MLSRIIWAARIDIQIALFCTILPLIIGTAIGSLVGYYGGLADTIFGRVVDLVITFPFMVLIIAIVAVLGPGLTNVYIAVGAVGWGLHAGAGAVRNHGAAASGFRCAGRTMGYSDLRSLDPPSAAQRFDRGCCLLDDGYGARYSAGVQPRLSRSRCATTHGRMGVLVSDGKNFMDTAWWMSVFPGLAIVLCGTGLSLLGDGVADLLAVKR